MKRLIYTYFALAWLMILAEASLAYNGQLNTLAPAARVVGQTRGEVVAISPVEVVIDDGKGRSVFHLMPETDIRCNNSRSSWEALRPVTEDAYFEAVVLYGPDYQVIEIRAAYTGGEYYIKNWSISIGQLTLTLVEPESNREITKVVDPEARLPKRNSWLGAGQGIYVLYNMDGAIRAVYLPD